MNILKEGRGYLLEVTCPTCEAVLGIVKNDINLKYMNGYNGYRDYFYIECPFCSYIVNIFSNR